MFTELQENYKQQSGLNFENAAIGHNNGRQQLYRIKNNLDFLAYMNLATGEVLERRMGCNLKPFEATQRVRHPPGRVQPASRKQVLHGRR